MTMKLRDYQKKAVKDLWDHFRERRGNAEINPLIVAPTGSGKSLILSAITRDMLERFGGMRVLVVTHQKELIQQNYEKMLAIYPESEPGIYSSSLKRKQTDNKVLFCGIQSVWKKAHELGDFTLIIVDECFTKDTQIETISGKKSIVDISIGDKIITATGVGVVEAKTKRKQSHIITLELSNGKKIHTTKKHPFFTDTGWHEADKMEGKSVVCLQNMRELWPDVQTKMVQDKKWGKTAIPKIVQRAKMLQSILCKEKTKSNGLYSSKRKNGKHTAEDWTQTDSQRRKWHRFNKATKNNAWITGRRLDSRTANSNKSRTQKWSLSKLLQSGYWKQKIKNCYRAGWKFTLWKKAETGREKRQFSSIIRVESISYRESRSDEFVYNLQVSGHPSYFANEVLVHNCHTIPVKGNGMYRQFISDMQKYCKKLYVVGLTASPFRLSHGYLHRGDGALFTDIAVDIPVADLIEQGYLTKLTTKQTSITIDTSQVKKRGGEFINSELESAADDVTEAALDDAIKRIQGRKTGLIFCVTIKHAQHACEYFNGLDINCGIITGRTPAAERDEQLNNLKSGNIDCLANVNCLTTGVDVPNIDYIIMLRPTESPGLYLQMCGRGMRLHPGKTDCLVLDYAGNIQSHGCIDALVINQKKPGEKGKAPVKTCPECDSVVHAALLECPDCGYQFPPPEMKIDHEAHQGAILLKDYEPEWFEISDVKYSRHEGKNGKPDTMRVDYYRDGGLFPVRICSEFICIYHDSGFPRKSAKRWLRRFNDTLDIDDLIVSNANDVLAKPKKILVNTTFKYPKIMDYHI